MLLVRSAADMAVAARATGDAFAAEAAMNQASAHATAAAVEAAKGRMEPGRWRWRPEFWMLHVGPELARAAGRADPAGWARIAETAVTYSFAHGECYARWRQAQDLVATGAPSVEVAGAVARGLEVGYANVPTRREIERLARNVGLVTGDPA
jgi:hypothetical protein